MKKDLYSYQKDLVDFFINNNLTEQTIYDLNPDDRQVGVKLILESDYYKARKRRIKLNKLLNKINNNLIQE